MQRQARTKLESFGVDPHDFSIIEHSDCKTLPSTSLLNVEVNQNTFSTGNVIKVATDVGTAVGNRITLCIGDLSIWSIISIVSVNTVSDVAQGVGQIYTRLANNATNNSSAAVPTQSVPTQSVHASSNPDRDVEMVTVRSRTNPSEFAFLRKFEED